MLSLCIQLREEMSQDGIRVFAVHDSVRDDNGAKAPISPGKCFDYQDDGIRIYTTKKFRTFLVNPAIINKPASQVYDMSSALMIGSQLRRLFKPKDKTRILAYRDQKDLYTGKAVDTNVQLSVDHIFEVQCMSHVIAKAFQNRPDSIRDVLVPRFKQAINIMENYNVTTLSLNCSKMNAFKWFLRENMYMAYPLEPFLLDTKCGNYVEHIERSLKEAHRHIRFRILAIRIDPDLSHYSVYVDDVLREFDQLLEKFRLN